MKRNSAENFMRSAKAPHIRAGVRMANVIWNIMKSISGMEPCIVLIPMP